MLNNKGFDLWANDYDKSVNLSEEENTYPFAGYKNVLGGIYHKIREGKGKTILDVGFGTGILSKKLYDDGYQIFGIDFSDKMIEKAKEKMPSATLIKYDFTNGFPECLSSNKFDFIICTYAIHHLDNPQKIDFINELIEHLSNDAGKLLIGDVAFATLEEMKICADKSRDEWDDEEIYPVEEVLKPTFFNMKFEKISFCSGIFTFQKHIQIH